MSDAFYKIVCFFGRFPFWVSSHPIVINSEITRRDGAYILAANHQSAYDIPILMRHTKRMIDFVSIVEVFRRPLVGWLYRRMNAFPLDRSRKDSPTVRIILSRLSKGRVIGMFPEGGFRNDENSVFVTKAIRPGIGRIAKLANVPIIPCVLVNSAIYSRFTSWLPFRRSRYSIIYGDPILPANEPAEIEETLIRSFLYLQNEITGQ